MLHKQNSKAMKILYHLPLFPYVYVSLKIIHIHPERDLPPLLFLDPPW